MKKQEVLSYLEENREQAVAFLRDLLRIDTSDIRHGFDGREGRGQLFLQKHLQALGMETVLCEPDYGRIGGHPECSPGHSYRGRPNLVGVLKGTGGGRSLILNGHMDTMAAENLDAWDDDPWSAAERDGNLYAVGACDMKAGLAAMVIALRAVTRFGGLRGDVLLESVVDEEGGGNGTLDLAAQGYTADAAIIGEPTGLQVMTASRGVLVVKIHVEGEAGHPNYKWEKANAIEKAFKVWRELYELEHRWLATKNHPALPRPTITIGKIAGGVAGTAVPASCDMELDVEFLPEEYGADGSRRKTTGEDIERELREALGRAAASDEWLRAHPPRLQIEQRVEPHSVEPDFELARLLAENHGGGIVSAFPAGCDARHLAGAGIKTVIYGPGSMADAHKVNEKVGVGQYLHCIRTLALTIMDWCGADG